MKATFDLISAIHYIKLGHDLMNSFILDNPEKYGSKLMRPYVQKLDWIGKDLISNTKFPAQVRDGIRAEWNSDTFMIPAIHEKLTRLQPQQREAVEQLIDLIISGKQLRVEYEKTEQSSGESAKGVQYIYPEER